MNMLTVLLGSTGLLLLVAVILSFNAMSENSDEDEIRKLEREIAALRAAEESAPRQGLLNSPAIPPPASTVPSPAPAVPAPQPQPQPQPSLESTASATPAPAPAEPDFPVAPADDGSDSLEPGPDEELIQEIKEAEREHAASQLRAENEALEDGSQVVRNPLGIAWQPEFAAAAKNAARADTIREAFLIARVTQYDEENGFAVAELLMPESAPVGTVLAIRRRTGIYGQVKVDHIYPGSQAIVNPEPQTFLGDEGIDIQPGDELIIPPP